MEYFVELLPKRKEVGPGLNEDLSRPTQGDWRGLKEELRANGQKGSVHKKAMQLLQNE